MQYERPDVYPEEVVQTDGPIQGAATGRAAMFAVTQKGPLTYQRHKTFAAWQRTYGTFESPARGDGAYEAKMFFDEGGSELITVRTAHYSNINDKTSFVGGVASRTFSTAGVAATAARVDSAVGPFIGSNGVTLSYSVDGAAKLATIASTRASITGSGLAIVDLSALTLEVRVGNAGNPVQTVVFGSEATVAEVVATVNTGITGGSAAVATGQLKIQDDVIGTLSRIQIVGGTALTELGLSIGVASGTGNVGNDAAITAIELAAIINHSSFQALPSGAARFISPITGAVSAIVLNPTALLTAMGLVAGTTNGTDLGATFATLKLEAGSLGLRSPGVYGNTLKTTITQTPMHPSAGAGSDLASNSAIAATELILTSISGLNPGSVIKVTDGVNTEYMEVAEAGSRFAGGVLQFFVRIVGTMVNAFLAAGTTIQSCEFEIEVFEGDISVGTYPNLSMLDTADNYVCTVINDENMGSLFIVATDLNAGCGIGADIPNNVATALAFTGGTSEISGLVEADWIGSQAGGTGFYALQSVDEQMPFATVGENSAGVIHAAVAYARKRVWFEYITYVATGLTGAQAVAFRTNVVGVNSSRGVMYAGGAKVTDPIGVGTSPKRLIVGLGGIMALRGRVADLPDPNGGQWQTPGGEGPYGTLYTALDVATKYDDDDAGPMNTAGINVIRKFGPTQPVVVMGGRTLESTPNGEYKYVNVRLFFNYVMFSVVKSTRWSVLRNNDFRLWGKLEDRADDFLGELLKRGAFPSPEKAKAYYVKVGEDKGVQTPADTRVGNVVGLIGMAPTEPGEFVIWRFTQFRDGSSSVSES